MTKEEIIEAISEDKIMPFIQPEQLAGIVDFVIKNHRPSLPSNLDEAARNYGFEEYRRRCYGGEYGTTEDAFKAGSWWLAGQGVTKEAVIGMSTEEITINVSQQTLNELDLCPGDKVVVQIRKK